MDAKYLRQLDRCRVPHDTGRFKFEHGGRGYWIVIGPVPLEVAWELFADPAGYQIRVAGHCGCPPPEDPWVTWRMYNGTELASLKDEKELERTAHWSTPESHAEYMKGFTFSDDPGVRAKAKGYVELYHIDSEVGLRVFMDHLKWHGLI